MAIAFGSAGTYYPDTTAAARTAAFAVPSGVASGDIVIFAMWWTRGSGTIGTLTLPSGFTNVVSGTSPVASITGSAGDDGDLYLFWKRATGADSGTYTASWTGALMTAAGQCYRYTGAVATGNPFDGTPGVITTATASTTRGPVSITTTTANTELLYFSLNCNTTDSFVAPTGFGSQRATSQGQQSLFDKAQAGTGSSGSITGSTGSSVGATVLVAMASVAVAAVGGGGDPRWIRTAGANGAITSWRNVAGVATPAPRLTKAATVSSGQPTWMLGLASNADPLTQVPRAHGIGCHIMRIEFSYSDSVATLKPVFDLAASNGIRVQPLAGWSNGANPVPDLTNLVTWAAAFGPGGTNWPGGVTALPMLAMELGNENAFSYKSGSWDTAGLASIAQSYGQKARALQVALAASSSAAARAVGTLVELDDGNSGSANWINNVKTGGGQALLDAMVAPTAHPYGPGYMTRINRIAGFLAAAGSTKTYYLTEYGFATDNGRTLDDNYGWPVNQTYAQAGTALSGVVSAMQFSGKVTQLMIYEASDLAATGTQTFKENYFGAVQNTGAAKGAYTSTLTSLFTAG